MIGTPERFDSMPLRGTAVGLTTRGRSPVIGVAAVPERSAFTQGTPPAPVTTSVAGTPRTPRHASTGVSAFQWPLLRSSGPLARPGPQVAPGVAPAGRDAAGAALGAAAG